jgi:ElaB/YqjD/DUF883 family membrane-anchored ribosome-binding protein
MTPATAAAPEVETEPTVRDRVIDACRQAAHFSPEARLLKSLAADAVDDGVHAAKRAITSLKRGVEELADLKDEAVDRVKRQPLRAVGIALGVGLVLGLAVGWIGRRPGRRE